MNREELVSYIMRHRIGRTHAQLADDTGLTVATVSGIIRREREARGKDGVARKKAARRHYAPEIIQAVCAAHGRAKAGELAKRFDMPERSVRSIWEKHKDLLPPPPRTASKPPKPSYALSTELGIVPLTGRYGGVSVARVSFLSGVTA